MTRSYIADYPRPQLVRPSWENLNGTWDFVFDDHNQGEAKKWYDSFPAGEAARTIQVPFCYEAPASGIGEAAFHPVVWYRRSIQVSPTAEQDVLLHFEGSDYLTRVWVNGRMVGEHTGGYTRFTFDITHLLKSGANEIVVRAQDFNDLQQPRGKQRWMPDNFGCWYIQTTGIWKTVWLEVTPKARLKDVKMTPSLHQQQLLVDWAVDAPCLKGLQLRASISFDGIEVSSTTAQVTDYRGQMSLPVTCLRVDEWGIKKWSPDHPHLYDIRFELLADVQVIDTVDSYFGMREIRIENGNILLNGAPLYQRLLLDQGYWEDGHLTPPSEQALIEDIQKTKAMGYNGVRKHQKTEDQRFSYWCDVMGLLTWCEMPSAYAFGDDEVCNFADQWAKVVRQYYNHPSIITWTPVNESWGVPQVETDLTQQHFTQMIYYLTKSMDAMRPVIVNDGWEHTISDIITLHDYDDNAAAFLSRYRDRKEELLDTRLYHCGGKSAMANGHVYNGQPVIISEYGGAAFVQDAGGTQWGYGNRVQDEAAYLKRIKDITDAIQSLPWVCGFCYTQTTDVQQEVNGLLRIDRTPKADMEAIRKINLGIE